MHFTKYFLLLLYIRTFAYWFCPSQSTSLSLPWCVQGMATPKEKHRGKKGSRDQKTVFASFEFCFFVVRRQWTGLAAPIWQRCIRSLCAGGAGSLDGRKWSERTPRGAFCVWRHNQQYFECFLCKVRRFFLSVLCLSGRACCFSLVVFAVRRWMRDCSNFRGLFQRLPIEFC